MSENKLWFEHKEVATGTKRLILSYKIYELFGIFPLRIITFFVVLGAFIKEKERRRCSFKFYGTLEKYTQKKYPPHINTFKQFLNYGNSLADKTISFSGHLKSESFHFKDDCKKEIFDLLDKKEGIFFLTTHIGNVEILRSLLQSKSMPKPKKVNIFFEKKSCEIFNGFLNAIKVDSGDIKTYAIEDIGPDTAIEISDKIKNGEIVFMAGDRICSNNSDKTYSYDFLGKKINLPTGALKFSQILKTKIFFITCIKNKKFYDVYAQKFKPESENKNEVFESLKMQYVSFLEKYTLKFPNQFYHFYDLFDDLD